VSSIRVKKGWKREPSRSRASGPSSSSRSSSAGSSSSSPAAGERARSGSSKCGEGRRARVVAGFGALVPLVLRRADFEGDDECDGGCLGRDILREGWGLHGESHGEVEENDGRLKADGSLVVSAVM
jgi:hypothetical protein